MIQLHIAEEQIAAAAGLAEVLAAAHAAFLTMLLVIEAQEDSAGPLFDTFLIARAIAVTGRLALLAAPSLPLSSARGSP